MADATPARLLLKALLLALGFCRAEPLPLHPTDTAAGSPPPLELAALAPAILAALFLVTLVLLLTGCVCCRTHKFTQFSNSAGNDLPEMVGTASSSQAAVAVDTGIVNPIADREFTIFGPLAPDNYPRPHGVPDLSPEHHRIVQIQFFGPPDVENNNPPFESNNNGPISPQELENIVNNNAENYIVSEYENRNLNYNNVNNENVDAEEPPQFARNVPSAFLEPPMMRHIEEARLGRLEEHHDWFENPTDYYPRNQLQYLQEIGRGWFGRIVEAETQDGKNELRAASSSSSPKLPKVAVKILDENVSVGEKCVFLDECNIYKNTSNKNVLKMIGYNLGQDPWLMIFEYCSLGDLKTFLRSNISSIESYNGRGIPLKFQCDIASAITYLHSHNIIHPDIACHSCMVSDSLTVKVGDYGGAVNHHPSDYFEAFDKSVPIRWLAPECWSKKFTKEGNIWSFGVLLWESCSWGALPYDQFSDEQVISSVLVRNGVRLQQPIISNDYVLYLYQVMQSCWQENPSDRTTAVHALSLLNYIYSNYFGSIDVKEDSDPLMSSFEERWQTLKPNSIPKIDNGMTSELKDYLATVDPEEDNMVKFDGDSICPAESEGSTEVLMDDFSEKTKSDSLTNLHGSLESIQERSVMECEQASYKCFGEASKGPLNNKLSSCEVAPWLQDLPVTSQEDMSYIKTVSDVISDLDNMLSSEKTSSSESSHQTSPSREISNHTVSSKKDKSIDTLYNIRKDDSDYETEVHADSSELLPTDNKDSVFDASMDEDANSFSQNNESQNVPELNTIKNSSEQDFYPTLDFRLAKIENNLDETREVHPIFQTKGIINTQDYDSLQDTSYIPDSNSKVSSDEKLEFRRQNSSGSETEDEVWKKRVEMGTITEKIKLKSKSVTDFMVLTHIDMDFTDFESEDTSYTSVDGKFVPSTADRARKRFKNDSPHKDSSLPIEEYLSFPRNFSFSLSNKNDNFNRPIDLIKLKKSLRNMTLRSIRPTKSMSDLSSMQNKNVFINDLRNFKKFLDSFLGSDDKIRSIESTDANISERIQETVTIEKWPNDSWDTTKYMNLPEEMILSHVNIPVGSEIKRKGISINLYESKDSDVSNACESFSVDLVQSEPQWNLVTSTPEINDGQNESNSHVKNIDVSLESADSKDLKTVLIKDETVPQVQNELEVNFQSIDDSLKSIPSVSSSVQIEDDSAENKPVINFKTNDKDSIVSLGPFTDCTLDLYTGLKTNFRDCSEIPEEEALMFSSNFNDVHRTPTKLNESDAIPKQDNYQVSSAYFFNSPAVPMNTLLDDDKHIDYSLETWDRFLGSSFDNTSPQNFDSIFPDVNVSSSHLDSEPLPEPVPSVSSDDDNNKQSLANPLVQYDYNYEMLRQRELNNLTSKLAIAENENNLNIEYSSQDIDPESEEYRDDSIDDNLKSEEDDDIPPYIEESETLEEVPSEGWFLHDKRMDLSNDKGDDSDSYEEKPDSHIVIDPESVKALRTELELKLPLAQMMSQRMSMDVAPMTETECYENVASCSTSSEQPTLVLAKIEPKKKSIDEKSSVETQVTQNEVLIHYNNVYGIVPLSPIQEESWSEFSEMARVGEFERSDTSNSLSLGQQNSVPIEELPLEVQMDIIDNKELQLKKYEEKVKMYMNDDPNDDSQGSNQTFVALDDENIKLNGRLSLSTDSLNCLDDQNDDDFVHKEDNIADYPLPSLPSTEPLYEEHSHTKSNEEISQNVDNLLKNISKTLKHASKIGSIDPKCTTSVNSDTDQSENVSLNNSSGSKTYVIEGRVPVPDDGTYVCNKVIDVPDDISNVSKITQPSFVSDMNTSIVSDSQLKPSDKSVSQNLHTKTPSMDSWCSNDTLFNVEENFDDICSFNDFPASPDKCEDEFRSDTPTNIECDEPKNAMLPILEAATCSRAVSASNMFKQPSVEMVMNYPENVDDINSRFIDIEGIVAVANMHDLEESQLHINKMIPVNDTGSNIENISEVSISDQVNTVENNMLVLKTSSSDSCNTSKDVKELNKSIDEDELSHYENVPRQMKTPRVTEMQTTSTDFCIGATSTPLGNHESLPVENKQYDMSQDSIDSAQNLIDDQFEFLDNIAPAHSSIDEETSCFDFGEGAPKDEEHGDSNEQFGNNLSIINYVSIEQRSEDYCKLRDATCDFLNEEKKFNNSEKLHFSKELSDILHDDSSKVLHSLIDKIAEQDSNGFRLDMNAKKQEAQNGNDVQNESDSLTYDEFRKSAEMRMQESSNILINSNVNDYDGESSALSEYVGHSGLDMELLQNKSDSSSEMNYFENPNQYRTQDSMSIGNNNSDLLQVSNLFPTGLGNIQFSGPVSDLSFNNHSYNSDNKQMEDINNLAPECLKEWDTASEESNANSSSSGEFTWKNGEAGEPITLSASLYPSPYSTMKFQNNFSGSMDCDVIKEEPAKSDSEGSEDSDSDEDVEFVPSSWNNLATPAKSALKSPETSQSEIKKKVAFKKQKHNCVYEYPREVSDNEGESPHFTNSRYPDWRIYSNIDDDPQFVKYDEMCNDNAIVFYPPSGMPDDDFYVSPSTAPFESFDLMNLPSQFFPGQHLSLVNSVDPYNIQGDEIVEEEPLPPAPSELLKNSEDVYNIIMTIIENGKSSDFITPDSGTEDVTPGSMIDYDFKDDPKDLKSDGSIVSITSNELTRNVTRSNSELRLNLVNKKMNSPNGATLILPDKSSPCGSITPSTPSPMPSGNSGTSSGSTSPLAILGGLRHTRDKLKLDLPPSPFARNSPNSLNSGRSSNSEVKIFDFKNINVNNAFDNHDDDDNSNTNTVIDLNDASTPDNVDSYISNSDEAKSIKQDDVSDLPVDPDTVDGIAVDTQGDESSHLDITTLQKAVVPINMGEKLRKSILEPVKGEGTLLDSGDEDSGIGSSAYTTLERKIDSGVKIDSGER